MPAASKLAAVLLTSGALLVSLAGCSALPNPFAPATTAGDSAGVATPSGTPVQGTPASPAAPATPMALNETAQRVGAATTVEAFYNQTVAIPNNDRDQVLALNKSVGQNIIRKGDATCDRYSKQMVALMPGFQYMGVKGASKCQYAEFEYSYSETVFEALKSVAPDADMTELKFHVPESAVELSNGNQTAVIDAAQTTVEYMGRTGANTSSAKLTLVYQNGLWVVDPARNQG
jgi:hypothetical protein